MMIARITQVQMQTYSLDLYIRPNIARDISMFLGFQKAAEVIEVGEKSRGRIPASNSRAPGDISIPHKRKSLILPNGDHPQLVV